MPNDVRSYTILAVAPLNGQGSKSTEPQHNTPLSVAPLSLDEALGAIKPTLYLDLPQTLCPGGGITLEFRRISDFSAESLKNKQPYLRDLSDAAGFFADPEHQNISGEQLTDYLRKNPHLPAPPAGAAARQPTASDKEAATQSTLDNILEMVSVPDAGRPTDSRDSGDDPASFYHGIIDQIITRVESYPAYRRLASAWLGLQFFANQTKHRPTALTPAEIRLQLLPCEKERLQETLDYQLPHLIDHPPQLVVVDYFHNSSAVAMAQLSSLCSFAENLLVPMVTAVDASFFHRQSWDELDTLSYLPNHLDRPEFAEYRKIRKLPSADWLMLTANSLLSETASSTSHVISPVWAIAALAVKRLENRGIPTGLSGQALAGQHFLEANYSEDRAEQLRGCGINPLVEIKRQDRVILYSELMLSGRCDFSRQALLSRFAHLILHLQDSMTETIPAGDIAETVQQKLRQALDTICPGGTAELEVEAAKATAGQDMLLHFRWVPDKTVLPAPEAIELSIPWSFQ